MTKRTNSLKNLLCRLRFLSPRTFCFLTFAFLVSCASTTVINIEGYYPSPLVTQLPLKLGVLYSDDFQNFSFTEVDEVTGEPQYIIYSGNSQVQLFNTVLPAVFSEFSIVDDSLAPDALADVDMIFEPAIEDFQIGIPSKTRLQVYEVWIKYNMKLSAPDGSPIADWIMTAYGKAPEESFNAGDGLNEAAVEAFRDLAATFSLGFPRIPEVNSWLEANI